MPDRPSPGWVGGRVVSVAAPVAAVLARAGRVALDLLLPSHCMACDAPVGAPGTFCDDCVEAATFVHAACCAWCGVGLRGDGGSADQLCGACHVAPPPWRHARGALRYDAVGKRVVLGLKYGDRLELAAPLAALMVQAGARLLEGADLLVPVPLHRARLRARRYNQAAVLARAVGRLAGVTVGVDTLLRVRATPPLGDLTAAERDQVVRDAFAVRSGRGETIVGRRVVLVDDVLTSGATAAGCTTVLLAAGAGRVDVLVAARVGRSWPAPASAEWT